FRRFFILLRAEKRLAIKLLEERRLLLRHRILIEIGKRGAVATLLQQAVHHFEIEARFRGSIQRANIACARRGGRNGLEPHLRATAQKEATENKRRPLHHLPPLLPNRSPAETRAPFRFTTAGPASTTRRTGMKKRIITRVRCGPLRPTCTRTAAMRFSDRSIEKRRSVVPSSPP